MSSILPEFVLPIVLVLSIPAGGLVFVITYLFGAGSRKKRLLQASIRTGMMVLVLFFLAGPFRTIRVQNDLHRTYLIDVSFSQPADRVQEHLETVRADTRQHLDREDRAKLVFFSDEATTVSTYRDENWDPPLNKIEQTPEDRSRQDGDVFSSLHRYRSFPSAVFLEAMASDHDGPANSTVLFTDGIGYPSSRDRPSHLRDRKIDGNRFLVPSEAGHSNRSKIKQLMVPRRLHRNEPLKVSANLSFAEQYSGVFRIFLGNEQLAETGVTAEAGQTKFVQMGPFFPFRDLPDKRHFRILRAELEMGDDEVPFDNTKEAGLTILEPLRVLYVTGEKNAQSAVPKVLRTQDFRTEVMSYLNRRTFRKRESSIDLVVLDRPSTDTVAEDVISPLKTYVQEKGGGLLVQSHGSSDTENWLDNTSMRSILPVRPMTTAERQVAEANSSTGEESGEDPEDSDAGKEKDRPEGTGSEKGEPTGREEEGQVSTVGLLLVIDKSGSMSGKKIKMVKEASIATLETLHDQDTIGILAFDNRPRWVTPPVAASRKQLFKNRVARLSAGGGTNIAPALKAAGDVLKNVNTGLKHVVLLSDGHSPVAEYRDIVEEMARNGITVSTVATGKQADATLLNNIAKWGNGSAYEVNQMDRIPQIFTREARALVKKADRNNQQEKQDRENSDDRPPDAVSGTARGEGDEDRADQSTGEKQRDPSSPTGKEDAYPVSIRDRVPFLRGFSRGAIPEVAAFQRSKPRSMSIVPLEVSMGDARYPLMSYWYLGSGIVGVLNTGFTPTHAPKWVKWEEFPRFYAQMVRGISKRKHMKQHVPEFDLRRRPGSKKVTVVVWPSRDLDPESAGGTPGLFRSTSSNPDWQSLETTVTASGALRSQFELSRPGAPVFLKLEEGVPGDGNDGRSFYANPGVLPEEFQQNGVSRDFRETFRSAGGTIADRGSLPEPEQTARTERKPFPKWPLLLVLAGLMVEIYTARKRRRDTDTDESGK